MQNWLGISIDFNNVEEKTSESSGKELLKEGFYRATIKAVTKTNIGANNKPVLKIDVTLDDYNDRELSYNLFLAEATDSENAKKFKNENLRNFLTRFAYRNLTKDEYLKISVDDITKTLSSLMTTQPNFAGAKVFVDVKQEPFISRDKNTKAINFSNVAFNGSICPKSVLKLIQTEQVKGIEFDKFPVILFSNKIAPCVFGFYNDHNQNAELKNSKVYDFSQAFNNYNAKNDDVIDSEEIPF